VRKKVTYAYLLNKSAILLDKKIADISFYLQEEFDAF